MVLNDLSALSPALQEGVCVPVRLGCSVKSLLADQFNILPEYIDARIKTVFLDGRPVDDFTKAMVTDGITLALSAAMPGLVGACFRSGGILSPFRSGISYRDTGQSCENKESGHIRIKLFNLLVKEIGPGLLKRGIRIRLEALAGIFRPMEKTLQNISGTVTANGQETGFSSLKDLWPLNLGDVIMLSIRRSS